VLLGTDVLPAGLARKDPDADYRDILPTIKLFHQSNAEIRCIVGPVGSGKTTAAAMEVMHLLPQFLEAQYTIKRTRWVVVRNTYVELMDTTKRTIMEWEGGGGTWRNNGKDLLLHKDDRQIELLLRSCDRPEDLKKFKSLEVTGYWNDESIEVPQDIKNMLKSRIGRFPARCPERYGIETTNPPDVEDPTYWQFKWQTPPPGPLPTQPPLASHAGFWQPPYENIKNLPHGYYEALKSDYVNNPDWLDMYILGKPGMLIRGKLVYHNFNREAHLATEPLAWVGASVEPGQRMPDGATLYLGWDNSGNTPACVVTQIPSAWRLQVLAEFHSEKMNIVDFARYVMAELNVRYPGCQTVSWGDPAGEQLFSRKEGGFTSNARLMREGAGVVVRPADNNFQARIEAVEYLLARRDGLLIDPSCRQLINGFLGGYVYPENRAIQGEYLPNVLKNKFSHLQDAIQYLAVKQFRYENRRDIGEPRRIRRYRQDEEASSYDPRKW
jgi:hypothetical protein